MKSKTAIVLMFCAGVVPTAEELEAGHAAGARFRNGSLNRGEVEACDFVMGKVPKVYADVPRYGEAKAAPDDEGDSPEGGQPAKSAKRKSAK